MPEIHHMPEKDYIDAIYKEILVSFVYRIIHYKDPHFNGDDNMLIKTIHNYELNDLEEKSSKYLEEYSNSKFVYVFCGEAVMHIALSKNAVILCNTNGEPFDDDESKEIFNHLTNRAIIKFYQLANIEGFDKAENTSEVENGQD